MLTSNYNYRKIFSKLNFHKNFWVRFALKDTLVYWKYNFKKVNINIKKFSAICEKKKEGWGLGWRANSHAYIHIPMYPHLYHQVLFLPPLCNRWLLVKSLFDWKKKKLLINLFYKLRHMERKHGHFKNEC